jgi:hypothetical protein
MLKAELSVHSKCSAMQKIYVLFLLLSLSISGFATEWVNFEHKDGGFKILFPKQPTSTEQEVSSEKGTINMKIFIYDASKYKDDNEMYFIAYFDQADLAVNSDMDDASVDRLLHNSLEGAAKNMSGEILSEKVVMSKGYRGREGKIQLTTQGNYVIIMRVYLVGSKMYLLQVASEAGKVGNASAEKFFSSFEILAGPKVVREKLVNNSWVPLQQKGFKILFPELPEESEQDLESKAGTLKLHLFSYSTGKFKDDNEAYEFMYSDYPQDAISSDFKDRLIDSFFNSAIRGMLKKHTWKKLTEKKISYKSFPGRSLKVSMPEENAIINVEIYLVRNRVYILEAICYEKNDNNAAASKFFNSFETIEN